MPAISFPTSPTVGQQVTVGPNVYTWDGTAWKISTGLASISMNNLTDADTTTTPPATGDLLRWDGTNWVPSTSLPSIDKLSDVDTTTSAPTTGQILRFNGTTWVPFTLSAGASALSGLSDVSISSPTIGNTLSYNGTSWSNVSSNIPFRNLIINGNFAINQRKFLSANLTDLTTPATNVFLADRFFFYQANNLANIRVMQGYGSYGLPAGFVGSNDYTTFVTYSNPSTATNDLQFMCHRIEGQLMKNLLWGTANAKPVTLSFWVRTTEAGFGDQKFGICIKNGASSAPTYVTTYLVPSANTWQRISITIPGPTTGSWAAESLQAHIFWNFFTGSSYRAPAGSSNAWLSTGSENYYGASDVYNFGSSSGRNFSIYGIQLEEGSVATPFENVPNEIAMMRCQRYYYNITQMEGGTSQEAYVGDGYVRSTTTQAILILRHPVPMMTAPSVNIKGTLMAGDNNLVNIAATINSQANNKSNSRLILTLASASTAYRPLSFYLQSLADNQLEVRAEI